MRSFTLLFAISGAVFGSPVPQAGGSAPPATPAAPAAPTGTPAPGGLPAGISLPPGLALPPGFDLGSIDLGQIGSLVGTLPPGFLDSLTAPGGLDALTGGAGGAGLDLGSIFGNGGPDNETPIIIAGYTATGEKEKLLDAAIVAIPATGDASAAIAEVIAKLKDVIAALKESATKVSAIGTVQLMAAAGLAAPGAEVTALFDKTADALVAKKDVIVKAGQGAALLEQAKAVKDAVKEFTDAINAHLPPLAKQSAQTESAKGLASADKIITAFST